MIIKKSKNTVFPEDFFCFWRKFKFMFLEIQLREHEHANIKVMFASRRTVFLENIERNTCVAYNTNIHTNGELDGRNRPRWRVLDSHQSQ